MNKVIGLLLVLALSAATLAGCGGISLEAGVTPTPKAIDVPFAAEPSPAAGPPAPTAAPICTATPVPAPTVTFTTTPTPPPSSTVFAYVKIDEDALQLSRGEGRLPLLMDAVLWIDGDDTETLRLYGIDPDDVNNDYALVNETETWTPCFATEKTVFYVQYSMDHYGLEPRDVAVEEFTDYVLWCREWSGSILATVTLTSSEEVVSVAEIYTP